MCQLNELEDIFDKESFQNYKIKRIGERPLDVLHADNNEIRVVSCRQVRTLSVITLDNNRIKNLNGLKGYTIYVYFVKNNLIDRHPSIFQVFNKMFNIEEIYLEGNPTAQIPNYKIEMAKVIPSLQLGLPCSLDSKPFTMEEQISAFSENTSKSNETFYDDEDDFDFSQFDHLRTRTMTESTESSIKHGMPRNMKLRAELTRKSSRSDFRIEEISKEEIGKEQKRMECQSYVISKLNILKKKSSEDPAKVIEADRFIRKIRRIIEGMEDPLVTDKFLEEERKRKEHEEEEKNTKKKDAGCGFLSKEKVIEIRFDDFENAIPVPLLYDIIKTAVSEKRTLKIRFVSAKKKWDGVMNITIPLDFPAAFTFLQVTNATLQDIVDAEQDKMDFLPKCDISPENLSVIREYFDKSQSDKSAGLSAKELLLTKKFEPSAIEEHPDIKKIVTLTLEQDEVDRPALDGINDMLAQI
ncbi:Protein-serine/threonine phosphatase [Entamoeba marina]